MRYSNEAMDALRDARQNNPNVSQRRLARNIFMVTRLDRQSNTFGYETDQRTLELFRTLNRPSEVALQHLIRGIDRQFRNEVSVEAAKQRVNANRRPRNRKTVGRGHRIRV